MKNIEVVLKEGKSSFASIVKATIYLTDMADYAKVNEEYAKFFKGDFPARTCVAVKGLPKNAKVEIECIAVLRPGAGWLDAAAGVAAFQYR